VASEGEAIRVRGLHVRYPGVCALDGFDLSISAGAFVVIGGRSGSGKSTLALALLGLLHQEEASPRAQVTGEILVHGLSTRDHPMAQIATQAGLVFQNPAAQLFNGLVEEEVAFGPRNLGLQGEEIAGRVAFACEAVGIGHLRGREVRRLSGGEQQRVAIAAALAMRSTILILDEPTANLDAEGTQSVARVLARLNRRFGVTVVVVEHRLEPFLPHAHRLIWLDRGRVVADGSADEVLGPGSHGRVIRPVFVSSPREPAPDATTRRLPSVWGGALVTVRRVTVGYEGHPVLRDCSLTLERGEFAGLLGRNGVGKSTLARVLAGLIRPRRGKVVWHGNGKRYPQVGFLQQNPEHQLVCQVVEEEVRFAPRNSGRDRNQDVEELLLRSGLQDLRHRPTHALSVGEQQRTALAATLALRPELLILDEPTIGQDWHHLSQLMDLVSELNRQGHTVLLITHDRRLVDRYAHRVWEMMDGKVQPAGGRRPAAMVESAQVIPGKREAGP
jgi:energy-coupling factor transport system ATP-binding protein